MKRLIRSNIAAANRSYSTKSSRYYKPSLLDTLLSYLKGLPTAFANSLTKLVKDGLTIDKTETKDDGSIYLRVATISGNQFAVRCLPTQDHSGYYDLSFALESGVSPVVKSKVPVSDIDRVLSEFARHTFPGDREDLSAVADESNNGAVYDDNAIDRDTETADAKESEEIETDDIDYVDVAGVDLIDIK